MAAAATEEEAITETQARLDAIKGAVQTDGNIVISGADVDKATANINGLTYKGFGMLMVTVPVTCCWITRQSIQINTGK